MAQDTHKTLPLFIQLDKSLKELGPEESPFLSGVTFEINANPDNGAGMSNPSGEGSNLFVLTPVRSNKAFEIDLPESGWNKEIGCFENPLTHEAYYFNYNSELNHSIHRIDGDTGLVSTVIIDPKLAFTDDIAGAPEQHRVAMRYVKDADGNIVEKTLVWTDGKKWQGWVNVVAAEATNGFDVGLYPYWALMPPHFDREELLEWPMRPPMTRPEIAVIENTEDDLGKTNRIVDQGFRFAIARQNTDGRTSTLSPYSLPLLVKAEEYLNDTSNIPKNALLTFDAGSPLNERLLIFVAVAGAANTIDPLAAWGDWKLYDVIDKFDTSSQGNYWERTNPWAAFNYDPIFNTLQYTFDNSKIKKAVSQEYARMLQTGMPQISQALTDLDDAVLLCNNRYEYDNFPVSELEKLSAIVVEKALDTCSKPMRTVYLYAYIGQAQASRAFTSQVGYKYGDDVQPRFGGLYMSTSHPEANIIIDESKFFDLNFADREAFRCYLKGTPYFADGEWYIVRTDNSLERIDNLYDFANTSTRVNVQNIFKNGGYFVCRFKLVVPAGRYIAAIGRHNVASTGDYRGLSTYVYGIANSRVKSTTSIGENTLVSIKPNSIVSYSKEQEIDCTGGNVDVWGNNADLFYIYCPYNQFTSGQGRFRFIEGYFKESSDNPLAVEMFPYYMTFSNANDWGKFTDKNGFYWAETSVADSDNTDIEFGAKVNCAFPTFFVIPTSQTGIGWMRNTDSYLASYNNGEVGDCNRIILNGTIRNLAGTIGYSNIAISIKDGATVYTRSDGTFTLIIHNGQNDLRSSNIYVNAGGNYIITIANCGDLPITNFSESLVPCTDCNVRTYPVPLNLLIQILNNVQTSLKQGGKYNIGCRGADLAGRLNYVNQITSLEVSSFLTRDNINATFIRMLVDISFNLLASHPDIKWFCPYISKEVTAKRYLQWVGDRLIYLDNNFQEVSNPSIASFVKIGIQSLYEANIASNFTLLAGYQFAKNDRLRVYDDGDGNLFDIATFGAPIDVQVLGSDYNQAAINAGLLIPPTNTVLDQSQNPNATDIGLICRYDPRFDRLNEKTGFWIEVFSPALDDENIPYLECPGFYPVINGNPVRFTGYAAGLPVYTDILSIDVEFWDTYYLQRNIGGKYFNHPFESPNVSDNWGANITSGGRIGIENKEAAQYWAGGNVARSDSFEGKYASLFREKNKTDYGIYPYGEIIAATTRRNKVFFVCENDFFYVNFKMPYSRVGEDGRLIVTNADENLSLPMPKEGAKYGMSKEDIRTFIIDQDYCFWFDRKNTAFIKSDFVSAIDITQASKGERGGIQSYLNAKTSFINQWNNDHLREDHFEVYAGIDQERGNVYLTFRPRRNNTNELSSYARQRRFLDLAYQETFVYSVQYSGWVPLANFAPEGYGRLRGKWANVEFLTFSAGKPYYHNNTPNTSFLEFYGQQTEPTIVSIMNKDKDTVKILQAISQNILGSYLFSDLIYGTQNNSFSFIPANYWKRKEKIVYAEVLRDMMSYPPVDPDELFRSNLFDGKRIFSEYMSCRFVQPFEELGNYFQLSALNFLFRNSASNKP